MNIPFNAMYMFLCLFARRNVYVCICMYVCMYVCCKYLRDPSTKTHIAYHPLLYIHKNRRQFIHTYTCLINTKTMVWYTQNNNFTWSLLRLNHLNTVFHHTNAYSFSVNAVGARYAFKNTIDTLRDRYTKGKKKKTRIMTVRYDVKHACLPRVRLWQSCKFGEMLLSSKEFMAPSD